MSKAKEIDHEHTSEIVCPHCGEEWEDSWEEGPGKADIGTLECYECGEQFKAQRYVSILYSTQKVVCKNEGHGFIGIC